MSDMTDFKNWLTNNTSYSKATVSDIISRIKRADSILPLFDDIVYQFRLEQVDEYKQLSCSVRSQIKKAVKLHFEYLDSQKDSLPQGKKDKLKILSLFSNIGVAEAYLDKIGFEVSVANELLERRAKLYSKIYPKTDTICGDITDEKIFEKIVRSCDGKGIDIIMATPPCQGMSTAGQHDKDDERNLLILPVISMIKRIKPNYVFLENVPLFLRTTIPVNNKRISISKLLENELGEKYSIRPYIVDTKDYSVPQTRERVIILMTKRDAALSEWLMPSKDEKAVTMYDAIGSLPILDPYISDVSEEERLEIFPHYYDRKKKALAISKWHKPPHHIKRQVVAMQHTPTGQTAFDNLVYYPTKENGERVKGYHNTYKRQHWNTAAYTVTMDNRKISSQNNVHPGRQEGVDSDGEPLYSDARALTLYEIMKIMSLPEDWPIPDNTSEAFLRRIIGEGIPPLFVKKVFENLK